MKHILDPRKGPSMAPRSALATLAVIGMAAALSGCGSGSGHAAAPSTKAASTPVAAACATVKSQTTAIFGTGSNITHAKDWLPLHRQLTVWVDQGGGLATTFKPFEAVVERRLETPDHDEDGLRIAAAAADDAIVRALQRLAPRCAAAGVDLRG